MTSGKVSAFFFIVCFFMVIFFGYGQQIPADTLLFSDPHEELNLPPLDSLIHAAIGHSGSFSYYLYETQLKEEELKQQQKDWLEYINITGDAGYGQFDQLWLNRFSYDYDYSLLTNSKQMRYSAGIAARIPLSAFINRRNNIKIATLNVDKAVQEMEQAKEQISSYVIELYFKSLSDYRVMLIREKQMESSELEVEKAEKDFIDSKIPFAAYSSTERNLYKAQIEFEIAHGEFLESLAKLSLITGIQLEYKKL